MTEIKGEYSKITWQDVTVKIGTLKPWDGNPKTSTKKDARALLKSWDELGQFQTIAIGPGGDVYDGHQRLSALLLVHGPEYQVAARQSSRPLTDEERRKIAIYSRQIGQWDWDTLSGWQPAELMEWGFDGDLLKDWKRDTAALDNFLKSEQATPVDAEPQIDRAAELNEKWGVVTGDLWQIGPHRLLCGDSTKREDVERVTGGERAILCHADPPYGMGKENEGIENDNLYREKLDAFQMDWWKACRPSLLDNASAYIWGNPEDLWRLWYRGLKDSERLTFRNEITWDKGSGQGMGSDAHRMYPTASERCLFFVIGEQGYNNNADNFWEGFEPLRAYLDGERTRMEWNNKLIASWFGFHPRMADHWFSVSQWTMPLKEQYEKLQAAANGDAFKREYDELKREYDELKREYDELKREFYATRAPFDNSHSFMTDVWRFETMRGDERPDHPTPKPPEMIQRIIRTSGTDDAPTLAPFLGSGPEMVAAQNIGRKVYGLEKSPAFCAVILERMATAFPELEIKRITDGTPN